MSLKNIKFAYAISVGLFDNDFFNNAQTQKAPYFFIKQFCGIFQENLDTFMSIGTLFFRVLTTKCFFVWIIGLGKYLMLKEINRSNLQLILIYFALSRRPVRCKDFK